MVSKEYYDLVQALGYGRTKDHLSKKRSTFYPLRAMVYCAVCGSEKYMRVGKNRTGSGKHVLTYRCDNKTCMRSPKSLRARNIFNSIYDKLEIIKLSDEAYVRYSEEIDSYTNEKIIEIKQQIYSKRGVLAHIKGEINDRGLAVGRIDPKSPAYLPNHNKLENLAIQQADIQHELKELELKIVSPNKIKLNKEEFLNLLKKSADKMKAGSAVEKDILCRILFLNLRVDNEKVVDFIWNEPFASLVKSIEIQDGGGGWT